MIALWMLRALAVSALLALAAIAADRGCRLVRRPTRFIWTFAVVASLVLPWLGVAGGGAGTASALAPPMAPTVGASPPRIHGGAPASERLAARLRTLDAPLLVLWALGSAFALARFGVGAASVARRRREWTTSDMDGVAVLLSHDFGPAVVGVTRWSIVLPSWVQRLDLRQRALVLAHEMAHLRAGDPTLLHLAEVATAFAPWNPVLWYVLRRLRLAVEIDCDTRVLQGRPPSEAHAYGTLLLEVGARVLAGPVRTAALAEPFSSLERRIVALTDRAPHSPRARRSRLALHGLASVGLATGASVAPGVPFAPALDGRDAVQSASIASPSARAAPDQATVPAERVDSVASREAGRAAAPPRRRRIVAQRLRPSGAQSLAVELVSPLPREPAVQRSVAPRMGRSPEELRAALSAHPIEDRGGPVAPRDGPDPFTLRAQLDARFGGKRDPMALRDSLFGRDAVARSRALGLVERPRGTAPFLREPPPGR
jgi:beta-lactamase regulating signal transducer with metallopeptidase domain